MTTLQRLQLEQSRARERLSEIAALTGDDYTDEIRSENDRLQVEFRNREGQIRAAIIAEGETTRIDPATSEGAEIRDLFARTHVTDYTTAALAGRAVEGAGRELNSALGIAENGFPMQLLAGVEHRTETDADGMASQQAWVDRVFAMSAAARIGMTTVAVPAGAATFPVVVTGPSAAQRGREEAATTSAWTVSTANMEPTRNSISLQYTKEDNLRLPGLGDALIRDMRMALTEGTDLDVFQGDAGADENSADIVGLKTATGIKEITLTQTNKEKGDQTLTALLGLIDGVYAERLPDLRTVTSVDTNTLWDGTIFASAVDNETIGQFLRRSGVDWTVRGGLDTGTGNGKFGAFFGRARGIEGAGVIAMWPGGELIRDNYGANAKSGQIELTLEYFWNFKLVRAANFGRLKFVT